jgi:uncharacterized protein (DUF488 family)
MPAVYTIGHSTRTAEEFTSILESFSIQVLVDIRTVPRSRKNPQYNREEAGRWLARAGIEYIHRADLGGLRHARKDSVNCGWRNESFRGYADYMQSPEFASAVEWLVSLSGQKTPVIMCAEAVPWRCHRSLVADALLVRSIDVRHIMNARTAKPHVLTSWAHVEGLTITYPAQSAESAY